LHFTSAFRDVRGLPGVVCLVFNAHALAWTGFCAAVSGWLGVFHDDVLEKKRRKNGFEAKEEAARSVLDSGFVQWKDVQEGQGATEGEFDVAFQSFGELDADGVSWDPIRKLSYSTTESLTAQLREAFSDASGRTSESFPRRLPLPLGQPSTGSKTGSIAGSNDGSNTGSNAVSNTGSSTGRHSSSLLPGIRACLGVYKEEEELATRFPKRDRSSSRLAKSRQGSVPSSEKNSIGNSDHISVSHRISQASLGSDFVTRQSTGYLDVPADLKKDADSSQRISELGDLPIVHLPPRDLTGYEPSRFAGESSERDQWKRRHSSGGPGHRARGHASPGARSRRSYPQRRSKSPARSGSSSWRSSSRDQRSPISRTNSRDTSIGVNSIFRLDDEDLDSLGARLLIPLRRLVSSMFRTSIDTFETLSDWDDREVYFDYNEYEEDRAALYLESIKVSIVLDKDERHFFELRLLKEADRISCVNWLTEKFSFSELVNAARRLDRLARVRFSRRLDFAKEGIASEEVEALNQRLQSVVEAMTLMRVREAEKDFLRTVLREDATKAAILEPPDLSQQLGLLMEGEAPRIAPRFIKFEDLYALHSIIGRGRKAVVWLAYRRNAQNVDLVVKVMRKKKLDGENTREIVRHQARVREEVEITKLLHHPNIIRTHDYFDSDETNIYIVMDLMKGGTLTEALRRTGKDFSEATARYVMTRVLRGVAYTHDEGIIHRDIRPANILCSKRRLPCEIKISDFGFAFDIVSSGDSTVLDESDAGSILYQAPEIAREEQIGPEVDVWACGVLMYFLLCGKHPFVGRNKRSTFEKIVREVPSFRQPQWRLISNEAQGLCLLLLEKERYRRIEARDALEHSWFKLDEESLSMYSLGTDWDYAHYEMEKKERSVKLEIMEMFGLRDDMH